MTRLIDADALKESVHAHDYVLKDCLNSTDKGMFTVGIMQAIDQQPTVDAVPVRHGKWIDMADFEQCSVCTGTHLKEVQGYYGKMLWVKTPYCPNCGARMDKE